MRSPVQKLQFLLSHSKDGGSSTLFDGSAAIFKENVPWRRKFFEFWNLIKKTRLQKVIFMYIYHVTDEFKNGVLQPYIMQNRSIKSSKILTKI